ncbi:MAG TPA: HAMP domain-containing protein [Anaerolineales bacterium]|nr:HAMP domain-containing protein [Anaerolineales bacterium]
MPAKTAASRSPFLSIRFKVLIPLMILLTVIFIGTYFGSQKFLKTIIFRFMKQEAVAVRDAALNCIDPDVLMDLTRDAQADPEADWIDDDRYVEIQECLLYENINYERAVMFTYYQNEVGTFAFGVDGWVEDDAVAEESIPFGEEINSEIVGEVVFESMSNGLLANGLVAESSQNELLYDSADGISFFGLASPIQTESGETVGGIDVLVNASNFIENMRILSLLLFGIFIAIYLLIAAIILGIIGSATSQLHTLNAAARRVAEGDYTPIKVKPQAVDDEVANLAVVFNIMLEKVRGREETLKQRVAELEIVIDSKKRQENVKEIVDSEFFQDLAARAAQIRASRKRDDK